MIDLGPFNPLVCASLSIEKVLADKSSRSKSCILVAHWYQAGGYAALFVDKR